MSNFAKSTAISLINGSRKNVSFSISSWFCLPDEGMTDFEILCRGSAFVLESKKPDFPKKFHIMTAAHVVAPWKFPKYYPEEWLKCVDHRHTCYTMEIRKPDGMFLCIFDILPRLYCHPKTDLAALHFEDDSQFTLIMKDIKYDSIYIPEDPIDTSMVEFHGHDVVGSISPDGFDLRKPIPNIVDGHLSHRSPSQTFLKSKLPLVDGMCGGPVISVSNAPKVRDDVLVRNSYPLVGLVQGIVPLNHPDHNLKGLAVIAESNEIKSFMESIERDEAPALLGGDSIKHVAKDQDPEKINIEKIFQKAEQEAFDNKEVDYESIKKGLQHLESLKKSRGPGL